jgi:Lar family restriction alleviation protein
MADLLDCPFCGKRARLVKREGYGKAGAKYSRGYVACNGCGITTPTVSPWEKAVRIWNSRAVSVTIVGAA